VAAETPAGTTHHIDHYSLIYVQGPGSIVVDSQPRSAGSVVTNVSRAEFATAFFNAGANPGVNEIAVVAFDDVGTSSNEADVRINVTSPAALPQPINPNDHTPPMVVAGTQRFVTDVGSNRTLTSAFLNVTDSNSAQFTPAQLTYTIESPPSDGYLLKRGSIVSSFTQSDINNGLIEYQENGTVASIDRFTYYVSDPAGNRSPNAPFTIPISGTPTSTHPTLDTNSSLSVGQGQTSLITRDNLHVTDTGLNSWQIIYTAIGGATHGQILADGVNVVHSFTQQQVDLGLIQYQNIGNVSGADDLTFTVSDAVGGSIGQTTFGITVIPKNNLQVVVERPLYNDPGANTIPPSGIYTPWDVSALSTTVLTATDQGVSPSNVVYTITNMPANTFF
jgi:Cadherin-like